LATPEVANALVEKYVRFDRRIIMNTCAHTLSIELQRPDLPLFNNLRIVSDVEVAARIAVDIVAARNCSSCMHVIISANTATLLRHTSNSQRIE
jgi:hypothetical protein